MKEEDNCIKNIEKMSSTENNRKQKTCVCISCFNHYETRMKHVIRFFESKGYKAIYITSDYNHFEKRYFKADFPNTIQVHVPQYNKNMSFARIKSQVLFSKEVYKYIKKTKPDIIFSQFPPNSLVRNLTYYKESAGCKLVLDGYDMWPESLPLSKTVKRILKPIFNIWANLRDNNIEKSDLILAVSSSMVNSVKEKWKRVPVKLFLPGVITQDLPSLSFAVDKKLSFCYLGNINHITDIDLMEEVLGELNNHKMISLHIIGEGQRLDELVRRLNDKGVKVICHGVVMDTSAKKEIYSLCNMAINFPREVIQSTMSLKSVEYMGVGLPFINSAGGDTWEIVDRGNIGINVDRNNLSQGISKILSLMESDLLKMHNNCIDYSKKRFETQNLEDIFKEVL